LLEAKGRDFGALACGNKRVHVWLFKSGAKEELRNLFLWRREVISKQAEVRHKLSFRA
jgi:hypothetical protein